MCSLIVALLLTAGTQAHAQQRVVSGQVLDAAGHPVAGATVGHLATEVTTDEEGRFSLAIPKAPTDIVVVADTFETMIATVGRGQSQLDVRLTVATNEAGEVIRILGRDPELLAETKPTRYEMGPALIRRVPGAGNDALKSIQTMPGVGRVPYGMGGLVLRGNSPRDSNVYLDGIEVPLLYHFGGLASFYPSTTLKSLELLGGGYSAEFGRALGGLVTVESRSPQQDHWRVTPEMSMIDLSLQADGPVKNGGVSVGLRRSIIDAVLPALGTSSEITTAPRYYDGQLRYDTPLWTGANLSARVFGSDDEIGLLYGERMDRRFTYGAQFARVGVQFEQETDTGVFRLAPWLGTDDFQMESVDQKMLSKNNPYGGRSSYHRRFSLGVVAGGIDLSGGDFEVKSTTIATGQFDVVERKKRYLNAGAWLLAKIRLWDGRANLSPGVRVEHYSLSEEYVVDPRLVVSHEVSDALVVRESLGIFHQPPAISDSLWGNEDLESSYSIQTALGAEYRLSPYWSAAATGFYSDLRNLAIDDPSAPQGALSNLTTSKLGALSSTREFMAKQFGTFSKLVNEGSGRNVGAEVMLKYIGRHGFAWLSYTGSRAERKRALAPEEGWTRFVLDQPHVLTVIGSTSWGSWQFGARARYSSGSAFTPILGGTSGPGGTVPIYGEEYSERHPDFYQLDLRIDHVWHRSWGSVNAFLDIQNITKRTNIEGRLYDDDYESFEETEGLPLFPAFGVSYIPGE